MTITDSPSTKVSLLTYNVGLLRVKIFGYTLFSNPDFTNERFLHLSESLISCGADILALQEIYEKGHVNLLLEQVKDIYPYHARVESHWPWQVSNGLLLLSKHPLTDIALIKHCRAHTMEKLLGCKAMLYARVKIPNSGCSISLVNMHCTAGGWDHPESDATNEIRESELQEAIDKLQELSNKEDLKMIIGDLNMGMNASECNYKFLCRSKYKDLILEAKELPTSSKEKESENADGKEKEELSSTLQDPFVTWDPENILNQSGPHAHCVGQRCDHIFVDEESKILCANKVSLVFTEPIITEEETKSKVTLSDHYGVQVEISVKG